MITWLFVVGVLGVPVVPMSFSASDRLTVPLSAKIVGHGVVVVHGRGVVTIVITLDCSTLVGAPPPGPPGTPWRLLMMRNTGERPWRTTSPHEPAATARALRARNLVVLPMRVITARYPLMMRGV